MHSSYWCTSKGNFGRDPSGGPSMEIAGGRMAEILVTNGFTIVSQSPEKIRLHRAPTETVILHITATDIKLETNDNSQPCDPTLVNDVDGIIQRSGEFDGGGDTAFLGKEPRLVYLARKAVGNAVHRVASRFKKEQ